MKIIESFQLGVLPLINPFAIYNAINPKVPHMYQANFLIGRHNAPKWKARATLATEKGVSRSYKVRF